MRWLLGMFLRGCLVLFPIVGTVYAVWFLLWRIDHLVAGIIGTPLPGLGLAAAVGVVTGVGIVASNVVGRAAVRAIDRIVKAVPLVGLVYGAIRDVVGAFVGERRSFDRPAMVRLGEFRVFGFVTNEHLEDPRLAGHVAVYCPQSYNFAGNLIVVPRERVELLQIAGPEFLAFVVSGGLSTGDRSIVPSDVSTGRRAITD
jgi:uncharacterized membrane protein